MRKRMLTTRAMPVVALGLAAALTFTGGAKLTLADQTDTTGRGIDATTLTGTQLTSPTSESTETGIRSLSSIALTSAGLTGVTVESTGVDGLRSLGGSYLVGTALGGPSAESETTEIRSLGPSTLSGALGTVAPESETQGGGRSLSPTSLTGSGIGGPTGEASTVTSGRTLSGATLVSGRVSDLAIESAQQDDSDRNLSPTELTGQSLGGPTSESTESGALRSLSGVTLTGSVTGGPAVESGNGDGGRSLSGASLTGSSLTSVAVEAGGQGNIRSLGPDNVGGALSGPTSESGGTDIRSLSPFGLTRESLNS